MLNSRHAEGKHVSRRSGRLFAACLAFGLIAASYWLFGEKAVSQMVSSGAKEQSARKRYMQRTTGPICDSRACPPHGASLTLRHLAGSRTVRIRSAPRQPMVRSMLLGRRIVGWKIAYWIVIGILVLESLELFYGGLRLTDLT